MKCLGSELLVPLLCLSSFEKYRYLLLRVEQVLNGHQ